MITYGNNSATKQISVPLAVNLIASKGGDGSKGVYITVHTVVDSTVEIIGGGKFYNDQNFNTGENTVRNLTADAAGNGFNFPNNLFIKVTSGYSRLVFKTKKLKKIVQIVNDTINSPIIEGDLSDVVTLTYFNPGVLSRSKIDIDISKLVNLIEFQSSSSYNGGVISGFINEEFTELKHLTLSDPVDGRLYETADITVQCNISDLPVGCSLEITGENIVFTGDGTHLNPGVTGYGKAFFYGSALGNCTANISAWGPEVSYIQTSCPYVVSRVNGMTKLGHLNVTHSVLSESVINQLLADLRANVAVPKNYTEASRTFNLSGATGSGSPSGQGITDKQFLIDWVGGSGQRNTVITR